MTLSLHLYNPSPYWRGGYVTTPWQPILRETGIPPERVVVLDGARRRLATQVHRVDPADPSRDVLLFRLEDEIAPGFEDYSAATAVVSVGERDGGGGGPLPGEAPLGESRCGVRSDELHEAPYLWFDNGVMALKFELSAAPFPQLGGWYAGSASSVMLNEGGQGEPKYKEVLDALVGEILGHDMEKRCMQVDRLDLSMPAWSPETGLRVELFGRPYEVISRSSGDVRESACVASSPFEYRYADPLSREERTLTCRLYRVLSLYRGADFVVDELSVRGTHEGAAGAGPVGLYFTARFFTYMDLGYGIDFATGAESPPLRQFRIDDWFGLRCDAAPFQGYGFATSAHVTEINNPHPGYPDAGNSRKSVSFTLGHAREATCLHLFTLGDGPPVEHRAGLAWYEHVFRPLRAKIAPRPGAAARRPAAAASRNLT